MKRILLLLCIFLIVSVYSFADQVEFKIEGNAKVTFGVDLNDPVATGFINETSSNLKIEVIAEQSDDKGADAPVYGWIKLKDFKWEVNKDGSGVSAPDVEAKIMADPVWVKIHSNPDVKVDKASIPVAIAAGVGIVETNALNIDHDSSGGLEIGVDTDAVNVVVKLVSEFDWIEDDTSEDGYWVWVDHDDNDETPPEPEWVDPVPDPTDKNTENAYAVSGEMSVEAVEGLTLKVMANAAMNYTTQPANTVPVGLGVGCEYELAISEDITIIPILGFDLLVAGPDDTTYEAGGGVRVKWPGTWDDEKDLKIFGDDTDVFSGLTVGVNYVGYAGAAYEDAEGNLPDGVINLVVSAYEDSGDDGFFPIIGAGASFEIADLTGDVPLMGLALVAYASKDNISGYAGMKNLFRAETEIAGIDVVLQTESLEACAGLEVSDIVPNTSLMIDWVSTELIELEDAGVVTQAADNGILTIAVKIAY
jgi:hypothetical protein